MKTYYSNINNFIQSTQDMENAGFEERYASYLSVISSDRKDHLLRFKNEKDRLLSMAGSLLLTEAVENINYGQDKKSDISNIRFPLNIA